MIYRDHESNDIEMDPIGGEQHDNQYVHAYVGTSCVGSSCNSTAALISEQYALDNRKSDNRSGIQEKDGRGGGELVAPKCDVPVKPPAPVSSQLDDVD